MAISHLNPGERVKDVSFGDDAFCVEMLDGRSISVPYAWFPRLLHATADQRADWQTCAGGFGIHWPQIDEDLSTEGLLRGAPAHRSDAASMS
jgi:hypothetical protein